MTKQKELKQKELKQKEYKEGNYNITEYYNGKDLIKTTTEHKNSVGVGYFLSLPLEDKATLTEIYNDEIYFMLKREIEVL